MTAERKIDEDVEAHASFRNANEPIDEDREAVDEDVESHASFRNANEPVDEDADGAA